MKRLIAFAVASIGCLGWAEELVWDVPAGETNTISEAVGSTVTKVTKTGGGTLFYNTGNSTVAGFKGDWLVSEGVLRVNYLASLGSPKTLKVEDGATIDFSSTDSTASSSNNKLFGAFTKVSLCGSGAPGTGGALVYDTGKQSDYFLTFLELTGDTTIHMNKAICMGTSNGKGRTALNGHWLTKVGSATLLFRENHSITNEVGGGFIVKGPIKVQGSRCFGEGEVNFPSSGNKFYVHKLSPNYPLPWKFTSGVTSGSASLQIESDTLADETVQTNIVSGSLVATGKSTVSIAPSGGVTSPLNFTGDIYGEAALQKWSAGCVRFYGNVTFTNSSTCHQALSGYWLLQPAAGKKVQLARTDLRSQTVLDLRQTDEPATFRYKDGNDGIYLGQGNANSALIIRGGETICSKIDMGRSCRTELTLRDGAYLHPWSSDVGSYYISYSSGLITEGTMSLPVLTLMDKGTLLDTGLKDLAHNRRGLCTSILNVNDGAELRTKSVRRYSDKKTDGDMFYVNVDGGILSATTNGSFCAPTTLSLQYNPNRVTIYEGGVTFDTTRAVTNGVDGEMIINMPLQAPEGKGLASIPWQDKAEFAAKCYGQTPIIEIYGTGAGASAFLEVDESSRQPSNIVLTARGWGYDETTRVAILTNISSTATTVYEFTPTLYTYPEATSSSWKGLTKRGAPELYLRQECSYYGPTTVCEGGLRFSDNARPLASGLVISNGAYVSFSEKPESKRTIPFVAGCGTIKGLDASGVSIAKVVLSAVDLLAGRCQTVEGLVTFPAGATVEVTDTAVLAGVPEEGKAVRLPGLVAASVSGTCTCTTVLPEGWDIRQTAKGLTLVRHNGAAIILK